MMLIVVLCSGSIPIPSRHIVRVLLSSVVTVTVAVDLMDVFVITSVTVNWNGGSENTLPWSRGRSDREMFNDGMTHWCPLEGIVHVNVTLSPGHDLSTLDCNWAPETENAKMKLLQLLLGVRIRSVILQGTRLHDLWTNTCGLVVVECAFWTVGHACTTKCEKCEKEGKASSRMWAHLRTAQNTKIWSFLKTTTCFICFARCCCSLSYSSFSMQTLQRWGCIYSVFSSVFVSGSYLTLLRSHHNFCHFDVMTMRPLAPLQRSERWTYISVHNFL